MRPRLVPVVTVVALSIFPVPRPAHAESARRGMVAAEHTLAAEAGVEMLRQGGNAVDAAVAAEFVTGVVNPSSCGIGGGGFMLLESGKDRRITVLDFRETAPKGVRPELYVHNGIVNPKASLRGALAVAVPGEVRGLLQAIDQFGNLALERVMAPAIRHAAEGFPVGRHLASILEESAAEIRGTPGMAEIYLKPDGRPYAEGETLVQSDLAETLRRIADRGAAEFYGGETGERIVHALAREGGVLTAEDLSSYVVRTRQPLTISYRELTIVGVPPPSSGGGVILEALNILAGDDVRSLGALTPTSLHLIAEAEKLAFADRAHFYGDPDFTEVPLARLLSPNYARGLRQQISARKAVDVPSEPPSPEHGGTSHLSVIDDRGYAVALTSTINTAFGSMIVAPGTGILLNNEMDDFTIAPGSANVYGLTGTEANLVGPSKRPLSSMSPTLVLRDRTPLLALGGSGGPRIISSTLQTLVNVIDFQMEIEKAVTAPRIHHQWVPNLLFFEPALDPLAVSALRRLGHQVSEAKDLGAVQAVMQTRDGFIGVADPRKGGAAVGW